MNRPDLKIMVVDDIIMNRKLLAAIIRKIIPNAQLVEAEDGQQAFDLFKKEAFSVILMDIQMPIMDGLESTKAIRSYEKAQNADPVPIIAITAGAFAGGKERCLTVGMNAYLTKPIDTKVFHAVLKEYLAI